MSPSFDLLSFLAGIVVTVIAELLLNWVKLRRATGGIKLNGIPKILDGVSVEVVNNSGSALSQAYGLLTIYNSKAYFNNGGKIAMEVITDQIPSPFKHEARSEDISSERVCWSIADNPHVIDIPPGATQSLDLMITDFRRDYIDVASEKGFSTNKGHSRAFLKPRERFYGAIEICSLNTKAKRFEVEIRPKDIQRPIIINPKIKYNPNLPFTAYDVEDFEQELSQLRSGRFQFQYLAEHPGTNELHPSIVQEGTLRIAYSKEFLGRLKGLLMLAQLPEIFRKVSIDSTMLYNIEQLYNELKAYTKRWNDASNDFAHRSENQFKEINGEAERFIATSNLLDELQALLDKVRPLLINE